MTKPASTAQRKRWDRIVQLGCIVGPTMTCGGRITVHHCGTGAGGRKDHDKVIPLCWNHHLGKYGIDGKVLSKKGWQAHYGSEDELLQKVQELLGEGLTAETILPRS